MTCFDVDALVEPRMNRVLTQYRESPKLLHLLRAYLRQIEKHHGAVCDLPEHFTLETAVGDQLTILGKRLGWPRCHCICDVQPVFGFECSDFIGDYPIAGFCDATVSWLSCSDIGFGDVCINDDELYRKFLKVRIYQVTRRLDFESLNDCLRILWGASAGIVDSGNGRVVIAPGRALTDVEIALLQLYPRVLPVALGVNVRFHFSSTKVFGFGQGWGGFCEGLRPDGLPIQDESKRDIQTENRVDIITGPLSEDSQWMCENDVKPYTCE